MDSIEKADHEYWSLVEFGPICPIRLKRLEVGRKARGDDTAGNFHSSGRKEGTPMMARSQVSSRFALASLIIALYATPAVYGIDWVCCGYCKPVPSGPHNNCYGYYP